MSLAHLIMLGLIDGAGGAVVIPSGGDGLTVFNERASFSRADWVDVDGFLGVYGECDSFADVFGERD